MGESEEKKKKNDYIKDKDIPDPQPVQQESTPHDSSTPHYSTYYLDLIHTDNKPRGTTDYNPSGSSYPWTDITKKEEWKFKDYYDFLKDKKTKKETKLNIEKTELDKINKLKTKVECHRYRLTKFRMLAKYDTYLLLLDNILKVIPVVLLSSLPLLLLRGIPEIKISNEIIIGIYISMIVAVIISSLLRWRFKNNWMTTDQYIIAVNKKEEEIVEQNTKNAGAY